MALGNLPAYQRLAALAAGRLGSSDPDIRRAILAQWQCEQPSNTWPPVRNNPGNNALGWARALGYPYSVQQPNPQPGNPIVTYRSPEDGAMAYADGLRLFSRYGAVRAAVSAGDGPAFLRAVTAAGYGTRYSCTAGSYSSLGGQIGNADLTSAPGAADPDVIKKAFVDWLVANNRAHLGVETRDLEDFAAAYHTGHPEVSADAIRAVVDQFRGKNAGQIGGTVITDLAGGVAEAIGQIPGAIGNVFVNVVLLLAIVSVIGLGLYTLAKSEA